MTKSRRVKRAGHIASVGWRKGAHRVWWGNLRERDHMEDSGVDGRIIFRCILRNLEGDTDWIDVTQDRDRWRALVNAVMNLRVP